MNDSWKRWYRRALPAYWVFLFLLTHFPSLTLRGAPPQTDKIAHVAAFGLLAFLFWRFAETFSRPLPPTFVWIAGVALVAYAAVDEFLQRFVNRGPDITDWLADAAGIVVVLAALEWRRRRGERGAGQRPPADASGDAPV